MKNKITELESVVWFVGGTLGCLTIWFLVKEKLIPPFFEVIHWIVLIACVFILAIHAYWKIRKILIKEIYTKFLTLAIGWIFGGWIVSRFS